MYSEIVDHQRLSGAGYCFSASAPPFLSAAAIAALTKLEQKPQLLQDLDNRAKMLYEGLKSIPGLKLKSQVPTPVMHLVLQNSMDSVEIEGEAMLEIARRCLHAGVAVAASKFAIMKGLQPSLMVCASTKLTDSQIARAITVIKEVARSFFKE